MKSLRLLASSLFVAAVCAPSAQAHFIWLHLLPDEARVEVLFGDGIYQDSETSLMSYVEGLDAWTGDETRIAFETHPWGLSGAVPAGVEVVGAYRDMGRFARGGPAVKLDYYSKAAATLAAAQQSVGTRGEIFAQRDDDELVVAVVFDGRPAIGAEVLVPRWGSLAEETLIADRHGTVRIPMPPTGPLALRAKYTVDEPGEYEGEPYATESHYALLTISDVGRGALPDGARAQAWLRLSELVGNLETFPQGLAGFGGVVQVDLGQGWLRGEFECVDGELKQLVLPESSDEVRRLVAAQLVDMIASKRHADFVVGWGRFPITIDERDGHPLGRRLHVGDPAGTLLRVTDDRILEREWNADGARVVERVLAYEETDNQRLLPTHVVANHFDRNGVLTRSESWVDTFGQAEGVYLPKTRTLQVVSEDRVETLCLELRNLEFFWAAREAAAPGEQG